MNAWRDAGGTLRESGHRYPAKTTVYVKGRTAVQFPRYVVMDELIETHTHAFIIKVWVEETKQEAGRTTWRGHITHAYRNERRYISKLEDIDAFIIPYLAEMGVDPEQS